MSNDSKLRYRAGSDKNGIGNNDNVNATDNDNNRVSNELDVDQKEKGKKILYGLTPHKKKFQVPHTVEMLKSVFDPNCKKSLFDYITFSVIGLQILSFFVLPSSTKKWVFFFLFVFWRGAYNMGLGWLLKYQSDKRGLVIWAKRNKIFDKSNSKWYSFLKRELSAKMDDDYDFDKVPLEFNTWLLFRQLVDLILLNDFTSYVAFALSNFSIPENSGIFINLLMWIGGFFLLWFNIWVKVDAHRVVKDFAWYWGDFFFLIDQSLTFDGVFEMAPHPMYSVGYIGYYGISMITASYTVLFVSLAAHAAQFAFLTIVENPHIDKTYNPPIPLNAKLSRPLFTEKYESTTISDEDYSTSLSPAPHSPLSSPQLSPVIPLSPSPPCSTDGLIQPMLADYSNNFRRDLIIFKNFDLFRSNDLFVIIIIFYAAIVPLLMAGTPDNIVKIFLVLQCLAWRIFHSYVLSYVLYLQSKWKFLTKHYVKFGGNAEEAFSNWKSIYNLSLCMTYVTFIAAAWKMYYFPDDWTYGLVLLRHTLGALLIALHVWTSVSVFEVLGDFGWFYGDFFMEDHSTDLYYTGIYRFVNNPEKIMGHAAFWGITLVANSWLIFGIALFSQISNFLFLRYIEGPHMKKLYGDKIRKEAGITKTIKRLKIIPNTVKKEMSKIRENTEIHIVQKIIKELKELAETVEKVVEEATDVFGPKFQDVVEEARTILQSSLNKLISQAAGQTKHCDSSRYSIVLVTPEDITPPDTPISSLNDKAKQEPFESVPKPVVFTLGSSINLKWTAPKNHSRKDWIGIYKVTSNSSKSVTSVSSRGHYMYVLSEDDEDLDNTRDLSNNHAATTHAASDDLDAFGELWFKGDQLPWEVGVYEFRYHHDNKHIVMAISQPFEIKAPSPEYILNLSSVEQMVLILVQKALDNDPDLIPYSVQDDYVLMKETHAKRIVYGIKVIFGVDFAWEVVAVDGNVKRLSRRIYKAHHVLSPVQSNLRSRSNSSSADNENDNNEPTTNLPRILTLDTNQILNKQQQFLSTPISNGVNKE